MVDDSTPTRAPKGRRRGNVKGGRVARHEVKVSAEEEGQLQRLALAQNITVPRLLIESALAAETGETATERRELIAQLFALQRQIAGVAVNVNQIAKAANTTHETASDLHRTTQECRSVLERIDTAVDRLALR